MALDPLKLYTHMKFHSIASVELELLHLDRKSVTFRKLTKGNNSKNIDARVMDLVHGS